MTEREVSPEMIEAYMRFCANRAPDHNEIGLLYFDAAWQASRQQALEEERAAGCLVADALRELLSDTQHKEHADCEDGGWCPVRDGRRALEEFEARLDAIRSLTSPIGDKA